MVPLVASLSVVPNVSPLSLLTLITGVSSVWFVSHHVTTTLSASESISTLVEWIKWLISVGYIKSIYPIFD